MIKATGVARIRNVSNITEDSSPSFSGIVTQDAKGDLWVDAIEAPKIAIVRSYAVGGFAFLGVMNARNELTQVKNFLENELYPYLKENGYNCFEFSVESRKLHDNIMDLFKEYSLNMEKEYSFRIYEIPENKGNISNDYQIKKVDDIFWRELNENRYENADFLKVRIMESWDTFEDFKNKSLAYCTIWNKRIVAVMVGTSCFNKVIAIDIETKEEHKRKGLAFRMAQEFIQDCLINDRTPQWDCVESNVSSYNLAKKLGFIKLYENNVYWFDL